MDLRSLSLKTPWTYVRSASNCARCPKQLLKRSSQRTRRSMRAVAVWSTTARHRTKRRGKVQCPQFRSRAKHERISGSDKVELECVSKVAGMRVAANGRPLGRAGERLEGSAFPGAPRGPRRADFARWGGSRGLLPDQAPPAATFETRS